MGLFDFIKRKKDPDIGLPEDFLESLPDETAFGRSASAAENESRGHAVLSSALSGPSTKSRLITFLLCWFLGFTGAHRFYVGKIKTGIAMLLTVGGLGLWVLVDFISILLGKFKDADGMMVLQWSKAVAKQGVVIYSDAVEFVVLKGGKVAFKSRLPVNTSKRDALVQALQELLIQTGVNRGPLPVALATRDVLFRYFLIPHIPRGEVESAVKFEARKYIPFKPDELVWDYHVSPSIQHGRMDVIYAAVPKSTYHTVIEAFSELKLKPFIIEPSTISLARLASRARIEQGNFVGVVQVQNTMVHIALIKDGVPYLARDVSLETHPAHLETEPTQGAFQKAAEDAMAVLQQRLISEIRVSTEFLIREYPTAAIDKVILYGDEETLAPWSKQMADELHCTVELGSESFSRTNEAEFPMDFAAAIGLINREGSKTPINFLHSRSLKESGSSGSVKLPRGASFNLEASFSSINIQEINQRINKPQLAIFSVLALGIMASVWIFCAQWEKRLVTEYDELIANRPEVEWGLKTIEEKTLNEIQTEIDNKTQLYRRLSMTRMSLAEKLNAIVHSTPDGVWLRKLQYDAVFDEKTGYDIDLVLSGASYLSDSTSELQAVQLFEQQVKSNEAFIKGLRVVKIGQIQSEVDREGSLNYQTFDLNATSKASLQ